MIHIHRILADTGLKLDDLPKASPNNATLDSAFNATIAILSVIAVLIIVLAGLKYVTSAGDPQGVASARKAIIYAAVGLAICIMAWSIVRFVLGGI